MWSWVVSHAFGWGLFLYLVLSFMGAGSADNLRGFRVKLFLACIFWPLTLVALSVIVAVNAFLPKRKRVPPFAFIVGRRRNAGEPSSLLGGF